MEYFKFRRRQIIRVYEFKIIIFSGTVDQELLNSVGDNKEKVVEGCLRRYNHEKSYGTLHGSIF